MAIREGRWDCPSCGSKAVYGRHVDCPGCGKPRLAGIRFYLTDDAPVITDAAQLAEATAGADWVCAHCAASTRATRTDCTGCGAARGTSPSQPVIDYDAGQVPRTGDTPAAGSIVSPAVSAPASPQPAKTPDSPETPATPAAPASSGAGETGGAPLAAAAGPGWRCAHCEQGNPGGERRCRRCYEPRGTAPPPRAADDPPLVPPENTARKWKIGAVALAAIVTLVALNQGQKVDDYTPNSFRPRPAVLVPATVAAVRWERHITIEERSLVQGTSFSLPDSAQVVRRERVVERYDSVADRYRTETREVPETRVVTEYETRTRQVSERVRVGTRTYVCGQRDLGNGYFEDRECTEPEYETRYRTETYEAPVQRTETYVRTVSDHIPVYRRFPVYGTRYHWRAPRWNVVRTATASGDTAAPVWPEPALTSRQRLGARGERYFVTLRRPGMPDYVFEIQPHEWDSFRAGQRLAATDYDGYGRPILFPADSLPACIRWRGGEDPGNPPPDSLGCSPLPAARADSAGAADRTDSAEASAPADSLAQLPN